MNIITVKDNDKITLKLDGWLDMLSSPELGAEIEKIDAASELILDFNDVEYIASAGLRQIVICYRKAKELNAKFSVINVCEEVMNIFTLSTIAKKIDIKPKA